MPPNNNININITANNSQVMTALSQVAKNAQNLIHSLGQLSSSSQSVFGTTSAMSRASSSTTKVSTSLASLSKSTKTLVHDITSLGGVLDAIPLQRAAAWGAAWNVVNQVSQIPGQLANAFQVQIKETASLEGELYDLEAYLGGPGGKELISFGKEMGAMGSEEQIKTAGLTLLQNKILEVGQKTPFTAEEIARATTAAAKAGVTLQEIAGDTGTALDAIALLSQNTGESLESSATQVSKLQALFESSFARTQKQFGLTVDTAQQFQMVVDGLATADMQSAASASELTQALFNVGGSASNLNLSFFETVALVSSMVPAFESAASAGTSLKYVFSALTGGRSVKAQRAMKDLGLMNEAGQSVFFDPEKGFLGLPNMVGKLREVLGDSSGIAVDVRNRLITDIFGQDALKAISRIVSMTDEQINEMLNTASSLEQNARQGVQSAAQIADIKNEGLEFDIEYFKGSMDSLQKTLTMPLMKPMSNIVQTFSGLANAAFSMISNSRTASKDIEEARREFISTSSLPGAAALFDMVVKYSERLGFAMSMITKEGYNFRSLSNFFAALLGVPLEGFSEKVIEIELSLRDFYNTFQEVMRNLPSTLATFRDTIGWAFFGLIDILKWVKQNWESIVFWTKVFLGLAIVSKVVSFTLSIYNLATALGEVISKLGGIKTFLMNSPIGGMLTGLWTRIAGSIGGGVGGAAGGATGITAYQWIVDFITKLSNPVNALRALFTSLGTAIQSAATAFAGFALPIAIAFAAVAGFVVFYNKNVGGLKDFTNEIFGNIGDYFSSTLSTIPDSLVNIYHTWINVFGKMGYFFERFTNWISNAFSNAWNWISDTYNEWEVKNNGMVDGLTDAFKGLVSFFGGVIEFIVGVLGIIGHGFLWIVGGGESASKSLMESAKLALSGLLNVAMSIVYVISSVLKVISGWFLDFANSSIEMYNMLPGVTKIEPYQRNDANKVIDDYFTKAIEGWFQKLEESGNKSIDNANKDMDAWASSLWEIPDTKSPYEKAYATQKDGENKKYTSSIYDVYQALNIEDKDKNRILKFWNPRIQSAQNEYNRLASIYGYESEQAKNAYEYYVSLQDRLNSELDALRKQREKNAPKYSTQSNPYAEEIFRSQGGVPSSAKEFSPGDVYYGEEESGGGGGGGGGGYGGYGAGNYVTSNVAKSMLPAINQDYIPVVQIPVAATFDNIANLHQFSSENLDVAKLVKGYQITYGERGIAQRGLTSIMQDSTIANTYAQVGTRASTFLSLKKGKLTEADAVTFQELLAKDRADKESFLADLKIMKDQLFDISANTMLSSQEKAQKTMELIANFDKKISPLTQKFTEIYDVKVGSFKDYQSGMVNVGDYAQYSDIAMGAIGNAISTALLPENQSEAFKLLSPEAQAGLVDSVKQMPLQAMAFLGDAMVDGVLSTDEFKLLETYVGEDVNTVREVLARATVPTSEDIAKAYTPFLEGTATYIKRENITGVLADSLLEGWDNIIALKMTQSGQTAVKQFVGGFNSGVESLDITSIIGFDPVQMQNTGMNIGENIIGGISTGITDNASSATKAITDLTKEGGTIENAANTASESSSPSKLFARTVGKNIVDGIALGITENAESIRIAIREAINGSTSIGKTNQPQVGSQSPWANPGVYNGIANSGQSTIQESNNQFYMLGQKFGSSIVKGMFGSETGTLSMSMQFLNMLRTEFNPTAPMPQTLLAITHFRLFGNAMGKAFIKGFGNILTGIAGNSENSIGAQLDTSIESIKTRYTNAFNLLGVALVNGIIAGLNSRKSALDAAMNALIQSAKNAGTATAEVNSPSLLFSRSLGSPIAEGIALGITNSGYAVNDAVSGIVNSASKVSFQPDVSATALQARRMNMGVGASTSTTNNYNLGVHTNQSPQLVSKSFAVMKSFRGE